MISYITPALSQRDFIKSHFLSKNLKIFLEKNMLYKNYTASKRATCKLSTFGFLILKLVLKCDFDMAKYFESKTGPKQFICSTWLCRSVITEPAYFIDLKNTKASESDFIHYATVYVYCQIFMLRYQKHKEKRSKIISMARIFVFFDFVTIK